MTNSHTSYLRRGGIALLGGAALTVVACIAVTIDRSSSNVSHDLFSYPLTYHTFVCSRCTLR
jgi:hypothetical protein